MSQDLPVPRQESHDDLPATVEWGSGDAAGPGRVARLLAALRLERRLAPLAAVLGAAVTGYASLVRDWTVTTVNGTRETGMEGSIELPAGVTEIGGSGIAYLFGLLGLVACLALVFFGSSPAVRHNARVAGMAVAGTLVVVLFATVSTLREATQRRILYAPEDGFRVEYGQGLTMAFVAAALLGLALYLAGRLIPHPTAPQSTTTPGGEAGGDEAPYGDRRGGDGGGWPWRRRTRREAQPNLPPPDDLTVTPATPFRRPELDHR